LPTVCPRAGRAVTWGLPRLRDNPAPPLRNAAWNQEVGARPRLAVEGDQGQELEEQVRREERRDLAGTVVLRRHLHQVEAHEVEAAEPPHERERLVGGQAA